MQDLKDFVEIEILLDEACNKVGFGFYFEDKASFVVLESRKRNILLDRENEDG